MDAMVAATTVSRRWGSVLAGVSIVGTVLAVMAAFLLAALLVGLTEAWGGGEETTWWYWLVAIGVACVGVAGLFATGRHPVLGYLLRLVTLAPVALLGLISFWLALPVVIVASAHVSLALSHVRWTPNGPARWSAAAAAAALFAVVWVPFEAVRCGRRGSCEYESLVGWGSYESQQLALWLTLVVVVVVLIGLPVERDPEDALV